MKCRNYFKIVADVLQDSEVNGQPLFLRRGLSRHTLLTRVRFRHFVPSWRLETEKVPCFVSLDRVGECAKIQTEGRGSLAHQVRLNLNALTIFVLPKVDSHLFFLVGFIVNGELSIDMLCAEKWHVMLCERWA